MGSTTTKGYPYPVGTDRVMDGDDAIAALAQAVEADALFTAAYPNGQSVAAKTVTAFSWAAATENGCALTKTSASVWTVTAAGLYVATACIGVFSQTGRSFIDLYLGSRTGRAVFTSDGRGTVTMTNRLIVGDVIKSEIFTDTAQTVSAGSSGGFLTVSRLGRSTGATAP